MNNWITEYGEKYSKLPSVPYWLGQYCPNLPEGSPIVPSRVKTPSMELWMQTTESQRQMLKEYAEWSLENALLEQKGLRTLDDIQVDMEKMRH